MQQENNRKLRLLKTAEMLMKSSDETSPLTTQTICSRLNEMGILCDRRTVSKDVALLNRSGYEILTCMKGHNKAYYIVDRSFSALELKILIDAVQAACFITEKKTAELIEKISALGGCYRAKILKSNVTLFKTKKHSNEEFFYNIAFLEEAITCKSMVSFLYFDFNEKGDKVYRKDKQLYIVEPVSLVYCNDYFFLVCYSSRYDNICNYRVDRMESVAIERTPVCQKAVTSRERISDYSEKVFSVCGIPRQKVTLEFDASLIGEVCKKFGESAKITRNGNLCTANVSVQMGPTFRGWVYMFDDKMRIKNVK